MIFSIRVWRAFQRGGLLLAVTLVNASGMASSPAANPPVRNRAGASGSLAAEASALDALRNAARAALQRRDPIAAEVPLREAIRNGASEDALRALLGEAVLARGNSDEAIKVLEGGDFTPDSAALGWRIRGQARLSKGDLKGAAKAFDQAYGYAPDSTELWVSIANLRFAGGEQALAYEAADRAVRLDPRNPRALTIRGLLVREQFGLAAALPWFEAGLRVAPEDPALLSEFAATLGDMGSYQAMLIVCRKLMSIDPNNTRAAGLQAILAARAGNNELARAILLRTADARRDSSPAIILLSGVLEYRAGNFNLAEGQFERLVQLQPDNLQASQLLARVLLKQAKFSQLVERYDGSAHLPGASPYLMQVVGQAWLKLNDQKRASALLARARMPQSRPASPLTTNVPLSIAVLRYGDASKAGNTAVPYIRALMQAERGSDALIVADQSRNANLGFAEVHLLAGDVRMLGGDAAGALKDFKNAAKIRFNELAFTRMDSALRALGKTSEADALDVRYLVQNPASLAAMKRLGASWRTSGRADVAAAMDLALAARGQVALQR